MRIYLSDLVVPNFWNFRINNSRNALRGVRREWPPGADDGRPKAGEKMELCLSVRELATLKNCTPQSVQKQALNGKLPCRLVKNEKNRPQYEFPLAELEPALQAKYYREKGIEPPTELRPSEKRPALREGKPLDSYTARQQEDIGFWLTLIPEWEAYRSLQGNKGEADRLFVEETSRKYPDRQISTDILYRKRRAILANDYDGLIDRRGRGRKGITEIPKEIKDLFLYFYLDSKALSVAKCREAVELTLRERESPLLEQLPSYDTMYRWAQGFSRPIATLARCGEKAFSDKYGVFVDRFYDDLQSNDIWIADGHTIDVITKSEDGLEQHHRLTLSAFLDARSGVYTGWVITDNPSADSTLAALRKGILRCGKPKYVYMDNGREYLNGDVGGLGHRAKKSTQNIKLPTPVLARLGIQMTNALPRNAQAKIIEREFRNFTFLSQLFDTYCGSNVVVKPEKLKHMLKEGKTPADSDLIRTVNTMIDGYFNQLPYGGKVQADRGKTRYQVYKDHLPKEIRTETPENLRLLMMQSTRLQTVGKNGVYLTIGGERLYYYTDELIFNYAGKKVFLRYDPEDLTQAHLYDTEEKFLMAVPLRNEMMASYNADKEEVKHAMRVKRTFKRKAKTELEKARIAAVETYGEIDMLDTFMRAASKNLDGMFPLTEQGNIRRLPTPQEREHRAAVGDDTGVIVDINRMIRNQERKNQL